MKKALLTATAGGFVPQFELNDIKLLQEAGYQVHYGANFQNDIYQWDQEILRKRGVILHHIPFENAIGAIGAHRKAFHKVVEVIKEEKIELIHCHTPFAGVLTRLAANHVDKQIPVIYTAHGFHFHNGATRKNWLFYPIEKYLSKKTDVLITINREDYKRAQGFTTKTKRRCHVAQIPGGGLDTERFCPKKELRDWMREQLQVPREAFHLVTIGELSEEKNVAVIIAALCQQQLAHLPIYYSVFGKGPELLALTESIRACGLEDRVKLRGFTMEPELVLQSADAFVFPSIREGLGMAALEALGCGVPVIAYDNRGTREYMQHGVNGLVCTSGAPAEYVQHIAQMYEWHRQDIYRDMQGAARKTAEAFGIEKTEAIMRDIYASVK